MFWPSEEPDRACAGSKPRRKSSTAENFPGGHHQQNRADAWRGGRGGGAAGNPLAPPGPTGEYAVAATTRREATRRESEHDGQDSFLYPDRACHAQSPLNCQSGTQQNFVPSRRSDRNHGGSPDGCHCHYNQQHGSQQQPTTYFSIARKATGGYQIPLYASPSIAAISHRYYTSENVGNASDVSRHAPAGGNNNKRAHPSAQRYEYSYCYGAAPARQAMNLEGRQQQCRDTMDPYEYQQAAAEARLANRQEAAAESSRAPGHGGSWHWAAAANGQMQPPAAAHQRFIHPNEPYPRHAAAPSSYRSHEPPQTPGSLQRDPHGLHAYRNELGCDEPRYHAREVGGCEGNPQHHWSPADYRDSAQNAYYPPPHNRAGHPSRTFDVFSQSTCTAPKRVKCFLPAPTQTTDEEVDQELPGQNSTFHPADETSATTDSPRIHGF